MSEILSQLSAFSVFLAIASIGFLFLLLSLIFGELFDHFGGGFDHDADHDLGHGGPSFFSSRVLSVFVTAFGGVGAIGVNYGMSVLGASAAGFASGVFFGAIVFFFASFLYGQQASTRVQSGEMVGKSARVVVAIPAGGLGQVRCQLGEEMIDKVAKAKDGSAIAFNSVVKIEEEIGEIVLVRTL